MSGVGNRRVLATTNDPLLALTERQKIFVDAILHGQSQTMAARTAGFGAPNQHAYRLMKDPKIIEALQQQHHKHEKAVQMTRKQVMEGMLDAIEMAKLQADPGTMVNGWREIGRMCGYYAAERKIIDVNISAKRVIDKLESLSDAELLEMITKDEEVIEGEFEQVLVATQAQAEADYAAQYDEA
jgi:hypothetical protein